MTNDWGLIVLSCLVSFLDADEQIMLIKIEKFCLILFISK